MAWASASTSARSPAVTAPSSSIAVDQTHRQRRVAADERQPGGVQQLTAGNLTAGVDPPEGDLDDVLTPSRPASLDEVGQLLVDPSQAQRRQPGPEHLAVQRVRQAQGGAPPPRSRR